MTFLTKFGPLLVLVLNAIVSAISPSVATFWADHATIASLLAPLALFFPQPHK